MKNMDIALVQSKGEFFDDIRESVWVALTIIVPRLNDGPTDFLWMGKTWHEIKSAGGCSEIWFDFSRCDFLQPNAVVFLGGLARMIPRWGGEAQFLETTIREEVRINLLQNGFAHAMGAEVPPWQGNSIPYREYPCQDEDVIVQDLRQNWLGRGWISLSEALASEILGQMWEIFGNAFEHSETPIGVHSCGQYFRRRHVLTLSVGDFGVGIPTKVRRFLHLPQLSGADAMRWAFQRGTSTSERPTRGPRGVGLDLLKELVCKTNGAMVVYSHDGHARIDRHGEKYENFAPFFEGTLVHIRLSCDNRHYMLSTEAAATNAAPFF
ncbi:MAG: ATP-binding protein [Pseudomonadota bacterium]